MLYFDNQYWQTCNRETDMVHSTQWGFGTVVEKCGRALQGLRILFDDNKMVDMDYSCYHGRDALSYIEPVKSDCFTYLKTRGVTELVHFTPVVNLPSIMSEGILPRSMQDDSVQYTDDMRLDNHMDASSFSISFPNYQMFYKKRLEMPGTSFAVLCIDPAVLEKISPENVAYYANNAARSEYRCMPFSYFSSLDALKKMFGETVAETRKHDCLPDFYTTFPQAEILIKDVIPPEYIKAIFFQYEIEYPGEKNESIERLAHISGMPFTPRSDWRRWK